MYEPTLKNPYQLVDLERWREMDEIMSSISKTLKCSVPEVPAKIQEIQREILTLRTQAAIYEQNLK